jgi:hypothetical protein
MQNKRIKNPISRTRIGALGLLLFLTFALTTTHAQEVVDKMVATINGGVKTDLITYSDLVWQLALQPGTPLIAPGSDALNRALQLVINQRLILQEAEKLPTIAPTDKEVDDELKLLIKQFPSSAEFYQRAQGVGLSLEQLQEIVRERVEINKYLDFRFRSFTVVSPKEVEDFYRDVWSPRWRRQRAGTIVPKLDETITLGGSSKTVREHVEAELTESKIESNADEFLDSARDRAEIVILNPV